MNEHPYPLLANSTVGSLALLARRIDPAYAEACMDSGCTNPGPVTDAEKIVSLLMCVGHVLNASGMCDTGHFEQYVDYPGEHGWRLP